MAKVVKGNMMEQLGNCDHFIVCGGSNLRKASGELVMMRGIGYELSQKFPSAPKAFGNLILDSVGDCGLYYLFCTKKIGLMQTQIVPRHGLDLGITSSSIKLLAAQALANPDKVYYLEAMWDGEPSFTCDGFIEMLPGNVTIWVPAE